jgi:hypothetical protein
MSDAPKDELTQGRSGRSRKRILIYALAAGASLAGAAYYYLRPPPADDDGDNDHRPTHAVFHIKHKPDPPKLAIEYHFDHNAIADSRLMDGQILGLTTSGNLVTLDAESFAARKERVLYRRATCLGPADSSNVVAGIANGVIVRVAVKDLAIERIGQVPGLPRWIGMRSKDGGLVVAYQAERRLNSAVVVADEGQGRVYDVGLSPVLFLDSKDRLWIASGEKVRSIDLVSGAHGEYASRSGWSGVQGFAELGDGQVWAFGGAEKPGGMASFVARLSGDGKSTLLFAGGGKRRSPAEPATPVVHVLEDRSAGRLLVVSRDSVAASDRSLSEWKPLDAIASVGREPDAFLTRGQAHLTKNGVILALARGGILEVTSDYVRRHLLDDQNPVQRPSEIVRLTDGMAFYGDGGPIFYSRGAWRPLPDPIMPPPELMGPPRSGEQDRIWAATTTIPIEGVVSYVITKAGPPRRYLGHLHGLRDVFLTARWDGSVLSVLGREDLPIEPDDTFATPDQQLWNVDDQGLWNYNGGRWRMVMRLSSDASSGHKQGKPLDTAGARASATFRSAIGEPLHFAHSPASPFHGLPRNSASWSLVRLDINEAGGVPLIDEIPVKLDGRRVLMRDLTVWSNTKDQLLLTTNRGLCAFSIKYGNCDRRRPEGIDDEVSLFMRDGTKRLWLGGRGLWVLRDDLRADAVHPSIPMLADTQVVAMAECPDGRLAIGTADRGVLFLSIPQGWFQRPPDAQAKQEPWEATRPHEPLFVDRSVVLEPCRGKTGQLSDAAMGELLASLREAARKLGGRTRVEMEEQFEGRPDIAVRGADADRLWQAVQPVLEKGSFKGKLSVKKRFGPPGANSVEVMSCSYP